MPLKNNFHVKAGQLGRIWLKANQGRNPCLQDVVLGLKKHYVRKAQKFKEVEWDE